ncbi:MAG: chemotaxis protein CheW [Pseudomonadota bacterium]
MDDFNLEFRQTFLEEFSESAHRMETLFMVLEKQPSDSDCIDEIFRLMHNTKGSSRAVGLDDMAKLAHSCESLLSDIRSGKTAASVAIVDPLLKALDAMRWGAENIETSAENPAIFEQAISNLQSFSLPPTAAPLEAQTPKTSPQADKASSETEFIDFSKEVIDDTPNTLNAVNKVSSSDDKNSTPQKRDDAKNLPSTPEHQANAASSSKTDDSIRVNLSKLDEIQNKFGEQVILQSVLDHVMAQSPIDMQQSEKMHAQLKKISGNLQSLILSLRMVPISSVFVRLNRAVRDVALSTNKLAELELVGGESELDKNILEQLVDPLVHMVRNSVNHGIETPEERRKKHKSPAGTIKINARRLGRHLEIEISDDGKGLSKEKILEKAYSTGLLPKGQVPENKEIFKLIFASGFSTKQAATEFSGRGVGMDVVRTNIEHIGGMIELSSIEGRGTTIKLKIPLTLAIVPGLIIKSQNQNFTIPQSDLVELVRIDAEESKGEKIAMLQGTKVLKLREKILPLLNLSEILKKKDPTQPKLEAKSLKTGSINIVILNADSFHFGLEVESVVDTADVVVKPLPSFLKQMSYFSGASIMGDGSVALTLDTLGMLQFTSSHAEVESKHFADTEVSQASLSQHQLDSSEFLMIDVGAPGNYVIPVNVVNRLEEFHTRDFEFSGEQRVVRYRNTLLPIFSLPNFLNLPSTHIPTDREKLPVVVIKRGDSFFGIEVVQILDVANLPSKMSMAIRDRPGILGTMAVNETVLVVVDVLGIIDSIRHRLAVAAGITPKDSDLGPKSSKVEMSHKRREHRILIVEDSSFFRNLMRKTLTEAGYQTEVACDGAEGWNTLENADSNYFSLVLSDIEMPELTGLELAKMILEDKKLCKIPLIAITTKATSYDREIGLKSGFSRYLEKLNPEILVSEIDSLVLSHKTLSVPREELKLTSNF